MKKLSVLVSLILLASCAPATTVAVPPTATPTATIIPTTTNTLTPQPTFTPTLTPTPRLPVVAGTPFPYNHSVISQENVDHLTNIARWGIGAFIDADYTQDMKKIVVATASTITYYDTQEGAIIWSKETAVLRTRISNNIEFMAVATSSGLELWNANDGSLIRKLEGIQGTICPTRACSSRSDGINLDILDFSPDNKYLGAQINENLTYFWSIPSGDLLPAPSGKSFSFSPVSSLVAISTTHSLINIYNTTNWENLYTLEVLGVRWDVPADLVFSPDSSLLASVSQFGASEIFVWGMANGEVIKKIGVSSYQHLTFISNNEIIIEDRSGNRMIDISSGKHTKLPGDFRFSFGSYKAYDRVLGFSADKEVIAVGVLDIERSTIFDRLNSIKEIQIWNINQNEIVQTIPLEGKFPECQFSDVQNSLSCIASEKFIKWDLTMAKPTKEIPFGISLAGSRASFSSDGTMLQAGNDVVEINSGKILFSSNDCCIGFSSNNVPIKLDDTGDSIKIINAQTGEIISVLETNPKGAIYHLSPDGSHLGIERNRIIQFWRISDGKFISSAGGAAWWVNYNYSPDGKFVGIANRDGAVNIDVGIPIIIQDIDGSLVIKLSGGLMDDSLAFSLDNSLVAISGYHNAKLFSFPDGQLIAEIGTSLSCRSMAFSINSDLLFCGLETGIIQILSISEKISVSQIPAHSNEITSLWLSPDGTLLGSGSPDGTTRLWAIYP